MNRPAIERADARRDDLDSFATFHLVLMLTLFPDHPPALLRLSIADLERELMARTIQMAAQREQLERTLAERTSDESRRAKKRQALAAFL